MGNVSLIEQNKKFERALKEIGELKLSEHQECVMIFEKAQQIANSVLNHIHNSFYVLKQFDGKGPIYKLEIHSGTLKILSKEIVNGIPEDWSTQDFYELLEEGNRLNVKLEQ
ncbi:hypothetical protein QTG56_24170 (plasmid) [Rossellomorea sp. AcN35-11]|nr:hypothetical protein [Rossellomorea aquimaris]WJV31736.1 hypothetical protein QTG56_24170 [Rossellomorea sp. AcN35-11]